MKKLLPYMLLMLAFTANSAFAATEKPMTGKKLVVIVTSDNVVEAGMGLILAHSAVKKGAKVTVVLGANSALYPAKKGGQNIFPAKGKTPRELLEAVIADGGAVYLCKTCAVFHGLNQEDLISGVKITPSMQIFDALFEENVRVMSY